MQRIQQAPSRVATHLDAQLDRIESLVKKIEALNTKIKTQQVEELAKLDEDVEEVKTEEFGHFFFTRKEDDGSIYCVTNDGSLHCTKLPAIITGLTEEELKYVRTIQAE